MDNTQFELEKFITNLEAKASYKNIKIGFKWENIPQFAVITGENGSGKTALLEQINIIKNELKSITTKVFNIYTNSIIQYVDNITLRDIHYVFYEYKKELLEFYKHNKNIEIPGNTYNNCINSYKNLKDKLTFESFIKREYLKNPNFTESEKDIIEGWRKNINFERYINFFKRHDMTEEKFLTEMTQNEVEKWLDLINDINIISKPTIFDEKILVNTFGNYFIKFENYKIELEKQYQDKSVKEIYSMVENEIGKNPLEKINKILEKYYSKYELDIKRNKSNNIKLICRNKESKDLVSLSDLSLGEQIIVSLIMWQYDDTTLDSVVLLLDEPDAHLNPKMAKMLIDILKNVVVKEFDCQVIMTTHSLSSVAYCDDEDLFFMENGNIRTINKKEAIEKLSDGIMTFDNVMNKIEQIQKSNKPTLMVEGIFDKLHIENFYKLSKKEIPFEIIECGGADNMSHFAIAFTQLKIPKEKILFLCDYDDKGCNAYDNVKVKYNTIYTLDIENIDKQDDRIRLKNYPLEMLYPLNILQENNLLERISLKEYLRDIPSEQQEQKGKEFSENKCKTANKLKENNKETFAKKIIQNLDIKQDFNEVKNLIDRIEKILIKTI